MPPENNQIFKTLFHSATEGIIISDQAGKIINANPAANRMFGYQSLIGKEIEDLLPEELREVHRKHRSNYHNEPRSMAMGRDKELYGQHQNGSVFPVEVSLSPSTVNGVPVVMAIVLDITQRKVVEQKLMEYSQKLETRVEERTKELRESQKLYSAIARNFPDGMISVFDRDLRYVFVEGKELYALGITSEALMGTRYMDRLAPEVAEQTETELLEVFKGVVRTIEIKYRGNDYVLDAVPIPDETGAIPHILVIEKNITKRKLDEEKVRRALEHERELNELKSRFVSTASHEFRTPLSTILSSVSLLSRYSSDDQKEKRDKHIERIKNSVHNLTGILNDFLSLDKLEAGVVKGNPEEFDIYDFVEGVCDQMVPTLKPTQNINYQHKGKRQVALDRQILNNILFNLLSNASKYSNGNDIDLTTILARPNLTIVVKDRGMGISIEDQKHLFERFFRAKSAINISGTGLGLNIVKKYIDLLGGSIEVDSVLGEGSTFTVKLDQSGKDEENSFD